MKNNIFLLCCVIAVFLYGCSKDDDSAPSYKDVNWFDLKDDPNDPLKHLIYEVYQKTGIPIFCNDTIGQQQYGLDTLGMPAMKYEILNIDYKLVNNFTEKVISYTLELDQEKLKAGVRFVGEVLHPLLPSKLHVHSLLLTKELSATENYNTTKLAGYTGFNTFVIGGIDKISTMNSAEKKNYAQHVLSVMIRDYLLINSEKELESFYKISENAKDAALTTYNSSNYGAYFWGVAPIENKWELLGFLDCVRPLDANDMFVSVSKEEDVQMFIAICLTSSEVDFRAKYMERKYILDKYDVMKELIKLLY